MISVKKSPVAGCVGFSDDPDHPGSGRPPVSPWLGGTAGRDSLSKNLSAAAQNSYINLLKIQQPEFPIHAAAASPDLWQ